MNVTQLNIKVISYCEIPEEISQKESIFESHYPDAYVKINVTSRENQKNFDDDFLLENWIIEKNPELEGEDILVHIDY
jgi:hypothetical protein